MQRVNGFLVDTSQGAELCTWGDVGQNRDAVEEQNPDHRCVSLGTQPTSWEGLKSPSVGPPGRGYIWRTLLIPPIYSGGIWTLRVCWLAGQGLSSFPIWSFRSWQNPHTWWENWSAAGGQMETHWEMSWESREQGSLGSGTCYGSGRSTYDLWGFWRLLSRSLKHPRTSLFLAGQRPDRFLQQPLVPPHRSVPWALSPGGQLPIPAFSPASRAYISVWTTKTQRKGDSFL